MTTIHHLYIHTISPDDDIASLLNDIVDLLPLWRKERVLSFMFDIDRFLCAKAFMLLKEGLSRDYHLNDEIVFSYNEYGKPFLANHPEIHFNLSHCRKGVACAISDSPIGVDIEEIMYDDELAKYVLKDDEYREVTASPNPALSFTKAWTRKESYLKMLGCGLNPQFPIHFEPLEPLEPLEPQSPFTIHHSQFTIFNSLGYVLTVTSPALSSLGYQRGNPDD